MGLGLSVEAAIPGRGILRRRPGRDRLFSEVCDTIREYVADPLMARMIHVISQTYSVDCAASVCGTSRVSVEPQRRHPSVSQDIHCGTGVSCFCDRGIAAP